MWCLPVAQNCAQSSRGESKSAADGELHAQHGATRPQRHSPPGALYLAADRAAKLSCCSDAQASISARRPSSAVTLTHPLSALPVTGQMLRKPAQARIAVSLGGHRAGNAHARHAHVCMGRTAPQ